MRALAVAAVIANHLPAKYLPSGHLGVDIFFVISGFVITASLLSHTHTALGKLYRDFFSRRIKRLLPALIVIVGFTSSYVLLKDPFPDESLRTGLSSLFGLSNITLYFDQLDYFAASSKFNAFAHTWSLGVEEQFYLFFPLLLWLGMFHRSNSIQTRRYVIIAAGISACSLLAYILVHRIEESAAFFLAPMRLWELGAGSLAYIYYQSKIYKPLDKTLKKISPILLLLLVAVLFAPSQYAVLATIGMTLLTSCLLLCPLGGITQQLLSNSLFVFIGQISYSLYLWHWPVITHRAFGLGGWFDTTAGIVTLMLALASASYFFLEKPLRNRKWFRNKGSEIAAGLAASALLLLAITGAKNLTAESDEQEVTGRFPKRFLPLPTSGKPHGKTCVVDEKRRLLTPTMFTDCTIRPTTPGAPMLWAMGDSHAGNLQGMLFELHNSVGTGSHLITTPGKQFPIVSEGGAPSRLLLYKRTVEEIEKGDLVLIPRLYYVPRGEPNEIIPNVRAWLGKIPQLAAELAEKEAHLVLVGPLPFFNKIEDIRGCSAVDLTSCAEKREYLLEKNRPVLDQLEELARNHGNVHVFDPFPVLCPPGEWCYPEKDGVFQFSDRSHLTYVGSKALSLPFLKFMVNAGLLR